MASRHHLSRERVESAQEEILTMRSVATLACKILSVLALLEAIGLGQVAFTNINIELNSSSSIIANGVTTIRTAPPPDVLTTNIGFTVPVLILAVIAALLGFQSDRIAEWMVTAHGADIRSRQSLRTDIGVLAFVLLGFYILASGIPPLIGTAVQELLNSRQEFPATQLSNYFPSLLRYSLQVAIGLAFVYGAPNLGNSVRNASNRKREPNDLPSSKRE